jgi:hypothetical protein
MKCWRSSINLKRHSDKIFIYFYVVLTDEKAEKEGFIRVIDESSKIISIPELIS